MIGPFGLKGNPNDLPIIKSVWGVQHYPDHYPDLGSASDWLNQISHAARPIRSTTQVWVVTRHQYGISELVSLTSLAGKPVVASPNVGCFLRLTSARLRRRYYLR